MDVSIAVSRPTDTDQPSAPIDRGDQASTKSPGSSQTGLLMTQAALQGSPTIGFLRTFPRGRMSRRCNNFRTSNDSSWSRWLNYYNSEFDSH